MGSGGGPAALAAAGAQAERRPSTVPAPPVSDVEGGGRRWSPSPPPRYGPRSGRQHMLPIGSAESFSARPHNAGSAQASTWRKRHSKTTFDTRPRNPGLAPQSARTVAEEVSVSGWRLDATSTSTLMLPGIDGAGAGAGSLLAEGTEAAATARERQREQEREQERERRRANKRNASGWRGPRSAAAAAAAGAGAGGGGRSKAKSRGASPVGSDTAAGGDTSGSAAAGGGGGGGNVGGGDSLPWQMAIEENAKEAAEQLEHEIAEAREMAKIAYKNGQRVVLSMPKPVSILWDDDLEEDQIQGLSALSDEEEQEQDRIQGQDLFNTSNGSLGAGDTSGGGRSVSPMVLEGITEGGISNNQGGYISPEVSHLTEGAAGKQQAAIPSSVRLASPELSGTAGTAAIVTIGGGHGHAHHPSGGAIAAYAKSNLLTQYEQGQRQRRGDISPRFLPHKELSQLQREHKASAAAAAAAAAAPAEGPEEPKSPRWGSPVHDGTTTAAAAAASGGGMTAGSPPPVLMGTGGMNPYQTSPATGYAQGDGKSKVIRPTATMQQAWAVSDYLSGAPPATARMKAAGTLLPTGAAASYGGHQSPSGTSAAAYAHRPVNRTGPSSGARRVQQSAAQDAAPQRRRCLSRAEQIQCAIKLRPTRHASTTQWPTRPEMRLSAR